MNWKTLLIGFIKGFIRVLADEYKIIARRRASSRTAPKKEGPPPEPTMGWGPPSPPPPVTTIRVETEEGARVAAASFIGSEFFGCPRVRKERQPGESRRTRRKPRQEATPQSAAPESSAAYESTESTPLGKPSDVAAVRARSAPRRGPSLTHLSEASLMTLARGETCFVA